MLVFTLVRVPLFIDLGQGLNCNGMGTAVAIMPATKRMYRLPFGAFPFSPGIHFGCLTSLAPRKWVETAREKTLSGRLTQFSFGECQAKRFRIELSSLEAQVSVAQKKILAKSYIWGITCQFLKLNIAL